LTALHFDPVGGAGRAPSAPRRSDLLSLLGRLTARDRTLLAVLADHQVLTTSQVCELAFSSLKVAQRRLLQLHSMRLVDRFRWHLAVGSQAWHYTLGPTGAALSAASRGTEPPSPAQLRRRQLQLAANPRLSHLLGVNGIFTALTGHANRNPDCTLDAWWSERQCAHHYGQLVRPDGYGTWTQQGRRIEFFVEYDTGTEPLSRLVAKLGGYDDLATAGGPRPTILFWFSTTRREANARTALAGHGHLIATTSTDLRCALQASPAGPIWLPAGASHRRWLIDIETTIEARP
jgi:hypothetical protein